MSRFEEGLGRIVFVAGASEFERPFLGPLYKFLTIHPRGSVRRLSPYVAFLLRYLAHQAERSRHYPCASELVSSEVAPRVDAQAKNWNRRLLPSVGGRRTARSKEIAMVQSGDPAGPVSMGVREGMPTFSDHLNVGSTHGSDGIEGVLLRRHRTAQEEGTCHAHQDRQTG